jgi:hypothetical protein
VLSAKVAIIAVPDHVCVGQIHIGAAVQLGLAASTKPLLELAARTYGTPVAFTPANPDAHGNLCDPRLSCSIIA